MAYVDYGTVEDVSLQRLRFMHKNFAKYPALCMRARLSGILPKDGFRHTDEISQKFYRMICNPSTCDLEVEVVEKTSEVSIAKTKIVNASVYE